MEKATVDRKQLKSVLKWGLKFFFFKKRYFHFNVHKLKALTHFVSCAGSH